MQALASIFGVFALILVLVRLRAPLAAAILTGAAATGLLFGLDAPGVLRAALAGLVNGRTIGLVSITVLQLVLSGAMQAGGQMDQIVELARAVLRRPTTTMAALPALIGLLPMPGGALFSAPMVEAAAGRQPVGGAKLSAINYWFRHIWEHWWPLYPGVILAMTLTGGDFALFAAFQFPLGVFMAVSGLLILRGLHPNLSASSGAPPAGTKRKLLGATSSIWIIILTVIPASFAPLLLPRADMTDSAYEAIDKFGPIGLGLLVAVAWTFRRNRLGGAALVTILRGRGIYSMVALVLSVMVFQHVLTVTDAARHIAQELQSLEVPVVLVVAILPMIAGAVTGLAFGFVGTSFPIVLPLVVAVVGPGSIRPYVALAYAFGHFGQMLSPLHLCHVVSNQYFKTPFGPVYRQIVPSAILAATLTVAYFVILRMIMG
jgi:hypothetical protein